MMKHHFVMTGVVLIAACSPSSDDPVITIDTAVADIAADGGQLVDAAADVDSPDLRVVVPTAPAELVHWVTGVPADRDDAPAGPGLILMGGGAEPDEAFRWWLPLIAGGDVVILRVSGSDGYNEYLYSDIGGVDSVETLKVDSASLADDPYVVWQIDHAEGVFLAGGNQWDYLSLWGGSEVQAALGRVLERGGVIGGTSAGLAVLGDRAFSAENDTVYSDEALADPYNEFMRFEDDFLDIAELGGIVTDSHFRERDRMGRLVTFVARMWTDGWDAPVGIGVDESTALVIGPAGREVVGQGAVYEVRSDFGPQRCEPGEPLEFQGLQVTRTTADGAQSYSVSAAAGALQPADPY